MKNKLGIYVHIPFCVQKCKYCDFLSYPCQSGEVAGYQAETAKGSYVQALLREIAAYEKEYEPAFWEAYRVKTVFFGGGTPSILPAFLISDILSALRKVFLFVEEDELEITLEANPGTLTPGKLKAYQEAGINRLSMGLQSTKEEELKGLGRIHTYGEFLENYKAARSIGFCNINVDIMSALPGQTIKSYKETLECVLALAPEHISAYSLIIEEGTPFYRKYAGHPELLPDEDTEREMYDLTKELLEVSGYKRYEISNYAKPGYECRHNLSYWERTEYIGLGIGAASLLKAVRFSNTGSLAGYLGWQGELSELRETFQPVSRREAMEEFMFLGLRKTDGILAAAFEQEFGQAMESVYGEKIKKLEAEELLEWDGEGKLMLTEHGIDVSNYVLAEFLLE